MFALQFISNEVFPLKKSDSVESALLFMSDWKVKTLPVVEGGKVIGMITEKLLLEKDEGKMEDWMIINLESYLVSEHTHLFDLLGKMYQFKYDTLAVVNGQNLFSGILVNADLSIQSYSHSSLIQEGSILVLAISAIQYSLAEISRICESHDVKIISLQIEPIGGDENLIHVSLKLNKIYLNHLINSLERFNYSIVYTNSPSDPNHILEDRLKWLVKYINT